MKEITSLKEVATNEIAILKKTHVDELDKVKVKVVDEYVNSSYFINEVGKIHYGGVNVTLNMLKRINKLSSDFNHLDFYALLPEEAKISEA